MRRAGLRKLAGPLQGPSRLHGIGQDAPRKRPAGSKDRETTDPIRAQDGVDAPGDAVDVSASSANLLDVSVTVQLGAAGAFGVFAVPGPGSALWGDDSFNDLAVPFDASGNVLTGTISVAVPEPSAFLFGGAASLIAGAIWKARQAARKRT